MSIEKESPYFKALTEEQKDFIRSRKQDFEVHKLKLESGAATPHEQVSHNDSIVMAGLLREELWTVQSYFDRAMLAELLVKRIRFHAIAEALDQMSKLVEDFHKGGMFSTEEAGAALAILGGYSMHKQEHHKALQEEMRPYLNKLCKAIEARILAKQAEQPKCPPAIP